MYIILNSQFSAKIVIKALILTALLIPNSKLIGQNTIHTRADTITSCADTILIPIIVTDFNDVATIKQKLDWDSSLCTYMGYQDVHNELSSNGMLSFTHTAGSLEIFWTTFTGIPTQIGDDTLLTLVFDYNSNGNTVLLWDTSGVNTCKYLNMGGVMLQANWENGYLNSPGVYFTNQPADVTVLDGNPAIFTVGTIGDTSFQWQVYINSALGFINCYNNTYYSGVTNDTLIISTTKLTMNNHKFRCLVEGICPRISNEAILTVIPITPTIITTIDSVRACPGDTVAVGVWGANFNDVASLTHTFKFNPITLTYLSTQNQNPSISGAFMSTGFNGVFRAGWYNIFLSAYIGNGLLYEVIFIYNGGNCNLEWDLSDHHYVEYSNSSATILPSAWIDGYIESSGILPNVLVQPVDKSVNANGTTSFSVVADTVSWYQWEYSSDNGITWLNVPNSSPYTGVDTETLIVNGVTMLYDQYQYRCLVYGPCDFLAICDTAILTIIPQNTIITTAAPATVCAGDTVIVPIHVTNFAGVYELQLQLNYNISELSYLGYINPLPELISGTQFQITETTPGNILIQSTSWDMYNGSFGDTVLVYFEFATFSGPANMTWDTTVCWYHDAVPNIIQSAFADGAITINPLPSLSFSGLDQEYCQSDNPDTLIGNMTPGGYFSGQGINDLGNGTAIFDPANAGIGISTITYSYSDVYSCYNDTVFSVTVHPLPSSFNITSVPSNGGYCYGSSGVDICVNGWEPGVNYKLYHNGNPTGNITGGQAGGFCFSNQTVVGTYTVVATTTSGSCSIMMNGSPNLHINPLPNPFTVTGGGSYCGGGTGVDVGLSSSQIDVSYTLLNDGSPLVPTISGTGSPITFGNQTAAGTYTVLAEFDTSGCQRYMMDSVYITIIPSPTADAGADVSICLNDCAILTASGGVSYLWSTSGANATTNVCPTITTTYTVTVTAGNGCTDSDEITVTIWQLPLADAGADQTINNGMYATLDGIGTLGGTPPYSWSWTPVGMINGSTSINNPSTVNLSTTQIYSLLITDTNGCSSSDNVTITVIGGPLGLNLIANPDTICAGDLVSLSSNPTGGTGVYSFSWSSNPTGFTCISMDTSDSPVVTTTYYITVDDGFSTYNDSLTVTVNPLPTANAGVDISICLNDCTNLTASGGVSYQWSTGDITATINVCPNITTSYSVTVTDPNGCTDSDEVTVTVWPLPTAYAGADVSICLNDCINLTASGGTTYLWNTGAATPTINICPNVTTTYTATVTDANGCTDSDEVTITVLTLPTANAGSDVSICLNDCTDLTASGGVNYSWSTGGANATINVCPTIITTYTVTVTDANGCSDSDEVTVTVLPLPTADAGVDVSICLNDCTDLTASGGVSYSWSNGGATAIINVCPTVSTTYSVIVTDANGCTDSDEVTVTVLALPAANAGSDVSICQNDCVTLTASGGASYSWSTGGANATINVCPTITTTYTVRVTDANGCTDSDEVIVTVNPLPTANAGSDISICLNDCTDLTATGGVTYDWNNGGVNTTINVCPTITTTYTVTVTDANGCTDSDDVTVIVNPIPVADAGTDVGMCIGESITLIASGGINYMWSTIPVIYNDSMNVSPTITTTYTVTVSDALGCSDSDDVIVTTHDIPIIWVSPDGPAICRDSSIVLKANGAASYIWYPASGLSSSSGSIVSAFPNSTTTYSLTGTSFYGCEGTGTVTVEVYPTPTPQISDITYLCLGESLTLNAGSFDDWTWYLWSEGSSTQSIVVDHPGLYWVKVSNPGCYVTDTIIVKQCTEIWVPNAFTPNGNYINDIFKAEASTEFEEFHMYIYTRTGQQIFESNNINIGWDGKYKGSVCLAGVYIWVIKYIEIGTQYLGKEGISISGTITLLR